jgi:hypothetical protein
MKNLIYILVAATTLLSGKLMADPTTDSIINVSYSNKTTQMVLVSATELGFKDTTQLKWSVVLDSAIAHGYKVCPRQSGLDLYMLLLHVNMANVPTCQTVFVGMNEITKGGNGSRYIYCLKTKGSTIDYKLSYASTDDNDKKFKLQVNDMFVFEQVK